VGFVVDKVALELVSSEYFGFPCQFSFHQMFHIHLSSGAGTVGKLLADVPSGLSLTPPHETGTRLKKEEVSGGWRKLRNDELRFYFWPNIGRVITEDEMGEICNSYVEIRNASISLGKPQSKAPRGGHRHG
jgi:hypothetical protein